MKITEYQGENYLSVVDKRANVIGSVLSEGSLWIILSVAAGLVVVKKRKKPAAADGAENEDEE